MADYTNDQTKNVRSMFKQRQITEMWNKLVRTAFKQDPKRGHIRFHVPKCKTSSFGAQQFERHAGV